MVMPHVNEQTFQYRGARAMVMMHEQELHRFLETWKAARARGVQLPAVHDLDYTSLEMLLGHVFRWAREYMVWMCDKLDLPDPEIKPTPDPAVIGDVSDSYLKHLLEKWRTPLVPIPEERFHQDQHLSPWSVRYSVDAMLEHAVMHPMRHRFQLMELMG
jgi:hypothetical protein